MYKRSCRGGEYGGEMSSSRQMVVRCPHLVMVVRRPRLVMVVRRPRLAKPLGFSLYFFKKAPSELHQRGRL